MIEQRFCTNCGAEIESGSSFCLSCGLSTTPGVGRATDPAGPSGPAPAMPVGDIPNYLPQAILATLCCCVPFGIVSIICAAQVNSKVSRGDIRGAEDASKKAKMWAWISFGLGLAVVAAGFIFGSVEF